LFAAGKLLHHQQLQANILEQQAVEVVAANDW